MMDDFNFFVSNTIATIEYSDEFEDNWDLFNKGIRLKQLKKFWKKFSLSYLLKFK